MDIVAAILPWVGIVILSLIGLKIFFWLVSLRVVVPPDEVHIVQSSGSTKSFGRSRSVQVKGTDTATDPEHQTHGNTYYAWPSWIPAIGVKVSKLPVSIFQIDLQEYIAYDRDRVPLELDLTAFFRIFDTNMAAERVKDVENMNHQLKTILRGAVRKILANSPVDGEGGILGNRALFGEAFTNEVKEQLKAWGILPVQNIELMDIRDAEGSKVIHNIQAVKQSEIDKTSRVAIAENNREASEKEIEAKRQIDISSQEAEQKVGERTAQKTQAVGVADEKAKQQIAEQAKETAEKNMAVAAVQREREATIAKNVAVIAAEQQAAVQIKEAEGQKSSEVTKAEGERDADIARAAGIEAEGKAKGVAEQAMLMAPVNARIEEAQKISEMTQYQDFQVRLKEVDAKKEIGIAQSRALEKAEIKIITTASDAAAGLNLVSLGQQIGGAIEVFKQTKEALSDTPKAASK